LKGEKWEIIRSVQHRMRGLLPFNRKRASERVRNTTGMMFMLFMCSLCMLQCTNSRVNDTFIASLYFSMKSFSRRVLSLSLFHSLTHMHNINAHTHIIFILFHATRLIHISYDFHMLDIWGIENHKKKIQLFFSWSATSAGCAYDDIWC
jgi:hypothetical protein